ncbi:protein kinase family protein [Jeotgalibacillus soli]|uniref:protein kinase family protein n=1 Tax=Jeotgalibacillus soli TaxID=889306 RepID=UPI000597BAFA|nr:protein kinase family protein [Jeotgalibacillus soli]
MSQFGSLAKSVRIEKKYGKIKLISHDPMLQWIGTGRSAVAFRIGETDLAIKVFLPELDQTALEEAEIYRLLEGISYYPHLYESGANYLVMSYIDGMTLFDCLVNGVHISKAYLDEVDKALQQASDRGLTPSDIHLRNILMTNQGSVKLIDVARFRQVKEQDTQWEDLKRAYTIYEKRYFPKKISPFWLNQIAALYKRQLLPKFERKTS